MDESPANETNAPGKENTVEAASAPVHRHSRHRRHRPWYKRMWRAMFPASNVNRLHVFIAVVVVVVFSILAGIYVALNNAGVGSSAPAP